MSEVSLRTGKRWGDNIMGISNENKLKNRIYPAINTCVSNRYRIITGVFAVYAFISSSWNANKDIINHNVSRFAACIFTFFVVHNALNYFFNMQEQYDLEEDTNEKIKCGTRCWYFFRTEGLFTIIMLLIIWIGYSQILTK